MEDNLLDFDCGSSWPIVRVLRSSGLQGKQLVRGGGFYWQPRLKAAVPCFGQQLDHFVLPILPSVMELRREGFNSLMDSAARGIEVPNTNMDLMRCVDASVSDE